MESSHAVLEAIAAAPGDGVLAIIISVEGSAYQKEGTCMWIGANGETVGLLSGGCLEEAVAAYARDVLANRQVAAVSFDLRTEDDLSWGRVLVATASSTFGSSRSQATQNSIGWRSSIALTAANMY